MAIPASLVLLLLATATLFSVTTASDSQSSVHGHRLKSYSEDGVEGCHIYNQTLGVCFDVKRGSLKIRKTTGEAIVHYQDLGPKEFFYQILEQAFVGEGPTMFYVPDYIPRETEPLRAFLKDITPKKGVEQREALKTHFQEAMSELHYVPEVQLLERVSAALAGNSTYLEILKPFHALCFYLMKHADVDVPLELKAAPDMEDVTAEKNDRGQRCPSLEGNGNNCLGLCGRGCTCWRWVCGDCCFHQGCYEHDRCCLRDFWSTFCLIPLGFSCSSYAGFPRCLN